MQTSTEAALRDTVLNSPDHGKISVRSHNNVDDLKASIVPVRDGRLLLNYIRRTCAGYVDAFGTASSRVKVTEDQRSST